MPKAVWKGVVLAESGSCVIVEGSHYFPPGSVKREYLVPSELRSTCPWKGEAHYCDVIVGSDVNKDAAWYYPVPKPAAKQIEGHVAFWKGVDIQP
jgi:uncharacterized protein (DUF427 family)